MGQKKSSSPGKICAALGKSLLYLLFYLGVHLLVGAVYFVALIGHLAITYGEMEPDQLVQLFLQRFIAGADTLSLISLAIVAGGLLLWFLIRRKSLGKAAGIQRCSSWTVGFCLFAAVGLYIIVSLMISLLPAAWLADYDEAMSPAKYTSLISVLFSVIAAPVVEELVFRGIIQSRLEQAMSAWVAVLIQAALFGFIHGQPLQISYAFVLGLIFGWIRYCSQSILPTVAAHMAFNAMNLPTVTLNGIVNEWYILGGMVVVCTVGCLLCRRGWAQLLAGPAREEEDAPLE